jgi:ethanolamine ammonia-lyase large subunit
VNDQEFRHTLALANAFKEGDLTVGGTTDDHVRAEARRMLLATTVAEVRRHTLVNDGVTVALEQSRDRRFDHELDSLTIAQLKGALLESGAAAWTAKRSYAFSSEAIAAVVKVMTNEELSSVARVLFNPLNAPGVAIGSSNHLGSRIQPNSPGDDEQEILFSILEGLAYGCGDVIIGLNPAADDLDTIVRLEQLLEQVVRRLDLPTRYCVLSDIVKQHDARRHTRIDVGFQSLAGTSRGLAGMVGLDVDGVTELARGFDGLYFETGQGSEVTNGAAEGIDMVTLEARTYGVARHIRQRTACRWMIVNDVAGFVGPEVFKDAEQLERACLEDVVMAKLHGLTMGPGRLRDVPHGNLPTRAAPADRAHRRSRSTGVSDGRGRQCGSDARLSDHFLSRTPSSPQARVPVHGVGDGTDGWKRWALAATQTTLVQRWHGYTRPLHAHPAIRERHQRWRTKGSVG